MKQPNYSNRPKTNHNSYWCMHINYRTYSHVLLQKELRLPLVYLKKMIVPKLNVLVQSNQSNCFDPDDNLTGN